MSDTEPDPPVSPITVTITIGAEDWGYVVRRLKELSHEAARRDPSSFGMYGGGGGGNYSCHTTTREVSAENYRAQLEAWRQTLLARRRAREDAEGHVAAETG